MSKIRINITVEEDLVTEAKSLGVNLSAATERALETMLAERRREVWLKENRAALKAANDFTARHGLWSDGKRLF